MVDLVSGGRRNLEVGVVSGVVSEVGVGLGEGEGEGEAGGSSTAAALLKNPTTSS